MNRREFIKTLGGGVVASSVLLTACKKATGTDSSKMAGLSDSSDRSDGTDHTMTYRTNPSTGDRVSLLGYGMMRLPVIRGGSARNNQNAEIDQEMVNKQVDYALEHGVNYFDTSPRYCQGKSEKATGIALSRHPRSRYFIATKLSNFSWDTWSREASQHIFSESLRLLKTDYIDYLLLHGVGMHAQDERGQDLDGWQAFERRYMDNGILDWLVEQKKNGKIRNLGFSYHGDIEVFDRLLQWHDEGKYHWDFVQIELNYLDWNYADEINPRNTDAVYLYDQLQRRGIMSVIMEPLLGGRLAKVPDYVVAKMKSRRPDDSIAQWAFRFAGTPSKVLTVLSGMTYMEHLRENVQTYSPLQPISTEENEFLMEIANDIYNVKTVPCNECNYCMPCPFGLNIPAIFANYNKMVNEGYTPPLPEMPSQASRKADHEQGGAFHAMRKDFFERRRRFLISYNRMVARERQADHCVGCRYCVSHCPQRIDIPQEMERIDRYVDGLKRFGGNLG